MARITQDGSVYNKDVVASVFSDCVVRPPKKRKQFQPSAAASAIDEVRVIIHKSSRESLAIGDEDFVYGSRDRTARRREFKAFFPNCASMSTVPLPGANAEQHYLGRHVRNACWKSMSHWREAFGERMIEQVFASTVDELLTEFVAWSYGSYYDDSAVPHLYFWVEHILLPYVTLFRQQLRGSGFTASSNKHEFTNLSKWQDIALTRLASLRVSELFDVAVGWDATASAIDDLKHYTTNPATRSYLTTEFTTVLSQRLLHPGASTIEILQIYISVIRAFRNLDPKGVLLERVARNVRRYLRDRDDTTKIVVAGLLSDISQDANHHNPDVLSELAVELQQREHSDNRLGGGELDWNNMEWMPDPVDAAPDYMKSKNTDVIGSLTSLFESKEIFVKELQTTLADRLLKNKPDFDQEIAVVEHLKIRFGDAALQGCEVMLRDVLDSKKVDQVIRRDRSMNITTATAPGGSSQLHTKILSRLFWPSLHEQTFNIPQPIREQQIEYEKGFESLKQSRKLTWLNAIGQVEIELELEDRTFQEEVLPWQASVIYAFQSSDSLGSEASVTKTLSQLSSELEMPTSLLRSSLIFWISKQILHESPPNTFSVLESLPIAAQYPDPSHSKDASSTAVNAAATLAAAEAAALHASREAEENERKAKMAMYRQFVISMLTNGGAMPLPRIAMMLGMVVPGGFPFGNEELREFLGGLVREGVLEIGPGGSYKVLLRQ